MPLAAYAEVHADTIGLRALVASPDGVTIIRATGSASVDQAQALGERIGRQLLDDGARDILASLQSPDL